MNAVPSGTSHHRYSPIIEREFRRGRSYVRGAWGFEIIPGQVRSRRLRKRRDWVGETKGASRRACFFCLIRETSISKCRVALIVQTFFSINRPALAKKEDEKRTKRAKDDFLLQLIESTMNFVTGKDAGSDSNSFCTEQFVNSSFSSMKLLAAWCVARLLRGECSKAKSDLGGLSVKEVRIMKPLQRIPLP